MGLHQQQTGQEEIRGVRPPPPVDEERDEEREGLPGGETWMATYPNPPGWDGSYVGCITTYWPGLCAPVGIIAWGGCMFCKGGAEGVGKAPAEVSAAARGGGGSPIPAAGSAGSGRGGSALASAAGAPSAGWSSPPAPYVAKTVSRRD